jgi:ATP-binding cassette subfamily C exporter for protease/lipase
MALQNPVKSRLHSELGEAFRAYKGAFITVGIFSFVMNILGLVPSLYMLQIYDRVLASRNYGTLIALTGIAVALLALLAALEWTRSRILVRVGNRVDAEVNERIFTATYRQHAAPGRWQPFAGTQRFHQRAPVHHGHGSRVSLILPWAPIYLAVCFALHPLLGWVSTFGLIVSIALAFASSRLTDPPLAQAQSFRHESQRLCQQQPAQRRSD